MTVEQLKDRYERIRIESKELLKELAHLLKRYRKLSRKSCDLMNAIDDNSITLFSDDGIAKGWNDSVMEGLNYLYDVPEFNDFDDILDSLKLVSKSKFKTTKKPKLSKFPKL